MPGGGDVTRKVETKFSVAGNAERAVGQLGGKFGKLGKVILAVQKLMSPLNAALGTLAGTLAVKKIADLGDQFEQTQITMAGFLSSLGISSNYTKGFQQAATIMEKIRVDAAALPGEAEEYTQVFKMGLPVVQRAIGGTISQMTAFTNRYTAIAKSLQVDSAQAARDLTLMLSAGKGRAGMDVRTFMQMLPFLKQVKGQADLTAQKFNQMTEPARAKLLTTAMAKMQPMLDRSASSFDAMAGALKSNSKEILRLATMPLFEAAKLNLERVNGLLFDAKGNLTPIGRSIVNIGRAVSNEISAALEVAVRVARNLWKVFEGLAGSPAFARLKEVILGLVKLVDKLGAGISKLGGFAGLEAPTAPSPEEAAPLETAAPTKLPGLDLSPFRLLIGAVSILIPIVTGMSGPMILVAGALLGLLKNTEAMGSIFNSIMGVVETLTQALSPVIDLFTEVAGTLGDMLAAVLVPLIDVFNGVLQALLPLWSAFMDLVNAIIGWLRPILVELSGVIGGVVAVIGGVLIAVLELLVSIIMVTVEAFRPLAPLILEAVKAIAAMIAQIGAFLRWLAKIIGEAASALGVKGKGSEQVMEMQHKLRDLSGGGGGAATPAGGGARGGGGRATNDFRFSKFEITQKFAEGFDPDRIAVAFAQDVGRIGEQRVSSSFEPLFSLR